MELMFFFIVLYLFIGTIAWAFAGSSESKLEGFKTWIFLAVLWLPFMVVRIIKAARGK